MGTIEAEDPARHAALRTWAPAFAGWYISERSKAQMKAGVTDRTG